MPARFLSLDDLKEHGQLPRFGSDKDFKHPVTGEPNANLCRRRGSFDADNTCFIYVSHLWLRPSQDLPSAGHPDDEQKSKYRLILEALEKLCGGDTRPIPAGMEVALWIDYCCIDQDDAPSSELQNLGNLIGDCDLMLTPVVDVDHASWEYPEMSPRGRVQGVSPDDLFAQYQAAGWQEYWSRGWCRVEAMAAAVKPVAVGRAELFCGSLQVAMLAQRRPHVLFGTKELEQERSPYFLPPLLHSAFDQFAPEKGSLTKESDRAAVRWLTEEARKDIKELVGGVGGRLGGRSPGRGAGWRPGRGGAAARAAKRGKAGGRQTDGKVLHLRGGAPLSRIC